MNIRKFLLGLSVTALCLTICACGGKPTASDGEEVEHNGTKIESGVTSFTFESAGDTVHYYFTAPEDGLYSIEGGGSTEGSAAFFTNDKYKSETDISVTTGYPDEEFCVLESHDFVYPVELSKGDTVYFGITGTDASSYSVCIEKGLVHPDRKSCEELLSRFSGGMYSFTYDLISSESPEKDFPDGLTELILSSCTTGSSGIANPSYITTATNGVLSNGDELSKYISDDDAGKSAVSKGTYYIYDKNVFDRMPSELWGEGRIKDYTSDTSTAVVSTKGFIFVQEDRSFPVPYILTGVADFDIDGEFAIVSAVGLGYDETAPVHDLNTGEELGINVYLGAYSSLNEASEILNIDVSALTGRKLVFYNTADGTRLYAAGSSAPSGVKSAVPALPSVAPDEYHPETIRKVSSVGGLSLKDAPDTASTTKITIPDKIEIRTYAEQDGFCYVKYMGMYGWVSEKNLK